MKLATLRSSHPDGELVLVSRDLSRMARARDIAPSLQVALDNWSSVRPLLQARHDALQAGTSEGIEAFDTRQTQAPLARAYQFIDGGSYMSHIERMHRMMGKTPDPRWDKEPFLYQAAADSLLGPHQDIPIASLDWNVDYEAEIAIITDEVPRGTSAEAARDHIALVVALNEVSLRALIPNELSKGFGLFLSKPNAAFTPVAVTPDELGAAWRDCKVHLSLRSEVNGARYGDPSGGESVYGFHQLVAYVASTRHLAAGTILSAGTVSNADEARGASCVAERRVMEQLASGEARTPWLKYGDRVRIDLIGPDGRSLCGAIDQQVVPAG